MTTFPLLLFSIALAACKKRVIITSPRFSAHRGNTVDRRGHAAARVGRHLAGVLQELEVRAGAGQSAVESRLQGHRDQRHRERQHLVEDIQSERLAGYER